MENENIEYNHMMNEEPYDVNDPKLLHDRIVARRLYTQLNNTDFEDEATKTKLVKQLFGSTGEHVTVRPSFKCDYGYNITFGRKVYLNCNCTILDVIQVTIGDHVLIGPSVQIYTALHPIDTEQRRSGLEFGKSVRIGADVWLGGGVIVCPGVNIGEAAVIGAGSVVVKDIPTGVFAAGNPCRVIRKL